MKLLSLTILVIVFLVNCTSKKADAVNSGDIRSVVINQVVGIGKIEPENEIIQVSAEVAGIVEKIYRSEDDSVHAGDIIAALKHTIEDANITQLNSEVAIQKAQIKVDQNAIRELQIRFSNASIEWQRLQNLLAKGAETRQVVDNAATEMHSYQANISKLEATVAVSTMRWKESNAQVASAEAQLRQKFIKAPVNGVLLELNLQPGNYIDSKQIIAQLKPEGNTIAVCEIDELFADRVKNGQFAIVRHFGAFDTLTSGKVYFAAAFLKKKSLFTDQAGEKEDRRVRKIKILLDSPGGILLNARVECVVFISTIYP